MTRDGKFGDEEENADALYTEGQAVKKDEDQCDEPSWYPDLSEPTAILGGNPVNKSTESHIASCSKE